MFALRNRVLGQQQQQQQQEGQGEGDAGPSSSSTAAASAGGGGWGLPRFDLRTTLQSSLGAGGASIAPGGLLFSYFLQGGQDDSVGTNVSTSTTASNKSRRSSSSSSSSSSSVATAAATAKAAATAAATDMLMNPDSLIDVILEERIHCEFDNILGRIVLKSVEEGKAPALLPGIPPGSVLVSVDGELLTVENFPRLMLKVQEWTNVPHGSSGPPPPPSSSSQAPAPAPVAAGAAGGKEEKEEDKGGGEKEAGQEDKKEAGNEPLADGSAAGPSQAIPSLHLTFRLATNTPAGIDYQDVFPLPLDGGFAGFRAANTEEALAHKKMIMAFRHELMRQQQQQQHQQAGGGGGGVYEGLGVCVGVSPSERLIEHFLSSCEWDIKKALAQFATVREEARELLAAHEAELEKEREAREEEARARRRKRREEGGGEEEEEEDVALSFLGREVEGGPRLVWDPAMEEPPDLEAFPLFEAESLSTSTATSPSIRDTDTDTDTHTPTHQEENPQAAVLSDDCSSAPPPLPSSSSPAPAPTPTPPPPPPPATTTGNPPAEFNVTIATHEPKLGITVENVLERTIICSISPNSCAFRAGMEEGCLVVGIGETSTQAMCHKEVVDRLMHTHRPLKLRLRRLSAQKLRQRREEMIALMHPQGTGGVGGDPMSLEARLKVVEWGEEKMLGLVRVLAVGSLLLASSSSSSSSSPGGRKIKHAHAQTRRQRTLEDDEVERGAQKGGSASAGAAGLVRDVEGEGGGEEERDELDHVPFPSSSSLSVEDRPELWRERVLDIATLIQTDLKRAKSRTGGGLMMGIGLSINERLRNLGQQLHALVELCVEFWWMHPMLAPVRWIFIDLVYQLLRVDVDASLAVSRDTRELTEGPAITLLQEMVGRLRMTQIHTNVNMLLYGLAGSYSIHARVACCALAPCVYARMPPPQQLQLRGLLMRFLSEEVPLIHAVVVDTLSDLAEMMDSHSIKWLFLMLEASASPNPSLSPSTTTTTPSLSPSFSSPRIRTQILQICYRVAQLLHRVSLSYIHTDTPTHNQQILQDLHLHRCKLLPFVNSAADDPEWQVRAAFAYFVPGFVCAFGEHWSSVFIDNLEALMRDEEVTVRKLAVDSIPKIAEEWLPPGVGQGVGVCVGGGGEGEGGSAGDCGSSEEVLRKKKQQWILDHLLPGFIRLVADPSVEVRASVAAATGKLLHVLTRGYVHTHTQRETQSENVDVVDVEVDDNVVKIMTPLMQRILHDEAPGQVALALLQGIRMDDEILFHGVGERRRTAADGEIEETGNVYTHAENKGGEDMSSPVSASGADGALHHNTNTPTQPPTEKGNIPLPLVESQVELLLPAVTFLASHPSWRVRQAVVEALPPFQLLVLPGHKYYPSLQELWAVLMRDGVEIVRRAAGAHLCLIGKLLARYPDHGGGKASRWLEEYVIPSIQECVGSSLFKQRQLGLHMVEILLREHCLTHLHSQKHSTTAKLIERELFPFILMGLNDPLANVRLVAASILEHSCLCLPPKLRDSENSPLVSVLLALCRGDEDRDVRFFAGKVCGVLGVEAPRYGGEQ